MKISNYKLKILLSIGLNGLFVIIGFNIMITNSDYTMIIVSVLLIVLGFNIHYDYLKYKMHTIMKMITDAETPAIIYTKIARLKKSDKLNGLSNSFIVPEILLSLDDNNPQLTLKLIEENTEFLSSKPDYLLIKRFTAFKAYSLIGNNQKTIESFNKLIMLKESNFKSKHMSLLFNWDEIIGIYLIAIKKYKKALNEFGKINDSYLNNREKIHLYYELYIVSLKLNKNNFAEDYIDKIKEINSSSKFID